MSDAKPDAVSGVPYLVTLVATETVSDAMLRRASETCMDHGGAEIASSRGDERMATIRVTMIDCGGLTAALEAVLPDVDVIVRPADMRPRLFVADMDSTMITVECIDELADFAGLKAEVSAVTEAAMRGELDFEAALRERVALLAGLEERAIAACLDQRVRPTAGAASLLQALRSAGVRCVLVSCGFTAFAEPVGNMLGFDRVVANVLEISDGVLTGRLAGPVVDGMT
ncbi:MAG: HAD-IB family phosphatase, partial [Pseudomonadota bacterium]